jgi:tetratricopeptide (TPR) repeat protein
MRSRIWINVAIVIVCAGAARAEDSWERPWIEVRTPNFTIFSALDASKTEALAQELEQFRFGVGLVTNIKRFDARVPTYILLLKKRDNSIGMKNWSAGYMWPTMRANYTVMVGNEWQPRAAETLKHEYVHFLIHNRGGLNYPTWFDEGFAELMSTLKLEGNVLEYGKAGPSQLYRLRHTEWMNSRRVLESRDIDFRSKSKIGAFYSQSWLLVHFLCLARPGRDFSVDNARFLSLLDSGHALDAAFEQAFGIAVPDLDSTLRHYVSRRFGYYRVQLHEQAPTVQPRTRSMTVAEIASRIAHLRLLAGEFKAAEIAARAALTDNPDHAPALTIQADLHRFAKRYADATPMYERAIALDPHNSLHELDYAEYFLGRAAMEKEPEQRKPFLVEARRHAARSYALDPAIPETLAVIGESYLYAGEDAYKGLASLQAAHDLLPSNEEIILLLARAEIMSGRTSSAVTRLRGILARSHPARAEMARALLSSIDTGKAIPSDASQTGQ